MPRKTNFMKPRRRPKTSGRRRLQPTDAPAYTLGQPVRNAVRAVAQGTGALKNVLKTQYSKLRYGRRPLYKGEAKRNFINRLQNTDNIITAPAIKIGTPREISFAEKVNKITSPPVLYKRNYQWSAECNSGRKGIFGIAINDLVASKTAGGGLYEDIMTQVPVSRLTTNTTTPDPTVIANSVGTTQQKFYVDYLSEKLNMVNSGSNSLTGKIKLWKYKRDAEATFTNTSTPMTPINLAMYASTTNGNTSYNGNNEGQLGLYGFDASTAGVNYQANYNMPGSAQNPGGATMYCDLAFDMMGQQIKEFMDYFFKLENTVPFSLKPGQQMNLSIIFNDLPILHRSALDMVYVRNTSYYVTVEFNAGIVGDSTATTGDNVVSTGSGQLSCMLTEKRIIGLYQKYNTRLVMPTTAPAGIAKGAQVVINPDTGIQQTGAQEDN